MRIALIVTRRIQNSFSEDYFAAPVRLSRMLVQAGFYPIFVGFEDGDPEEIISWVNPSICILTGGDSIGDNSIRDDFEYKLLNTVEKLKVPVIGICRGMQMMASSKGVSLTSTSSHAGGQHMVFGREEFLVNSYHNYAVTTCPIGFSEKYRATDGSIESFFNESIMWTGIMWHPEREEIDSGGYRYMLEILKEL